MIDQTITNRTKEFLNRLDGDSNFKFLGDGLYKVKLPNNYRKMLYIKIVIKDKVYLAQRLSLTDERINSITIGNNKVRTNFAYLDKDAIYYINKDDVYIELKDKTQANVQKILLGYDKRLIAPEQPKLQNYDNCVIDVRKEFEDAIVLYGIYFLLQRYSKDTDRIQMALNNYKYYVEDLTYTLAYEDNYADEDGTICLDRV